MAMIAAPKDMEGEFRRIQMNALGSWRMGGGDDVDILLIDNFEGAHELQFRWDAKMLEGVAHSQFTTASILSDAVEKAMTVSNATALCVINSDIMIDKHSMHVLLETIEELQL